MPHLRNIIAFLIILTTLISLRLFGNEVYVVPMIKNDISFNNGLNDPVWKNALRITIDTTRSGQKVGREYLTEIYWLFNGRYLYIAAECFNPNSPNLYANKQGRDGHLWKKECLEFFPGNTLASEHLQLIVNPAGDRYDSKTHTKSSTWNGMWSYQVEKKKGVWTAFIRVPISDLKDIWEKGCFITFNMARGAFNPDGSGEQRMDLRYPAAHNPTEFLFLGPPNPAALGKKLAKDINDFEKFKKLTDNADYNKKTLSDARTFCETCETKGDVSPKTFFEFFNAYKARVKDIAGLKVDLLINYMFSKQS